MFLILFPKDEDNVIDFVRQDLRGMRKKKHKMLVQSYEI